MRAAALSLRHELIGLAGVVERNVYLTRRYIYWDLAFFVWTVANTLTIVFIAKGIEAGGGQIDVERATTTLLIGAVVWAYLGIIFEFLTETVAWERWEGTIEYTFMAPLSRAMHLGGSGVFAVLYGLVRAILLFIVVAAFFGLAFDEANFAAALVILVVASVSFFGIGMMTAVLPLISPEKGAQLGFVAQGMLLVVSGVYYPVDVLPDWMQWLAKISPATYALDGIRAAILDGASLGSLWHDIWPLLVIGAASHPARPRDLQPRGDLREAARKAEALRLTLGPAGRPSVPDAALRNRGHAHRAPHLPQAVAQRQQTGPQRERDRVRPVPGPELRDHPLAIALHGLGGEVEPCAGLRRGLALRSSGENLLLPRGERLSLQDLAEQRGHAARLRSLVEPVCTSEWTRPVLTPRSRATSAALSPSTAVRTSATRSPGGRVPRIRSRSRDSTVSSGVGRGSGGSYVACSPPSPAGPRSLKLTTSAYVPSPSALRRARERIASRIAPLTCWRAKAANGTP